MSAPRAGAPTTRRRHRGGVTLEARLAEFERDLELMAAELARLEAEHDRYHAALAQIANSESGAWGWIARDALHPNPPDAA